nr:RNA polymerase sigma factor [Bacteroides sp. UBA939]
MNAYSFKKDLVGMQEELLRFTSKLIGNKQEANDLLQETTFKALDNEEKYTPDASLKGWFYAIMSNLFINSYRKIAGDSTVVAPKGDLYHLDVVV